MNDDTEYERIRAKLQFDPLTLDAELMQLPMLVMDAGELASDAQTERDRCKNELDLMLAEAADVLRQRGIPDAKGGTKQRSEAQIDSEIILFQTVQDATAALEKAKHRLALCQTLVDALRTKRDSLKVYAELVISGYLSPNHALDVRKAELRAASTSPRRKINPA